MLKYLVSVTEDLLMLSILTGLLFAFARKSWEKPARRAIGIVCAIAWAAAAAIAVLKKSTTLIDSGLWNIRFALTFDIGALLLIIAMIPVLGKKLGAKATIAQQVGVALMILGCTGYYAPEPLTYPNVILLSVKTVMSTDFFFRLVGWLLGLAIMLLLAISVVKVVSNMSERVVTASTVFSAIFVGLILLALALRAMISRRLIPRSHTLFQIVVFATNNGLLFSCILGAIALACSIAIIRLSIVQQEPYDNPAQHRKIRAKWRNRRRWATAGIVCLVLSIVNVTAVKAYDSREVELSPSEEFELRDDGCYIPFEQVDDGHLHRFTYTSPNGVGIRFIIIKKPGGSSYGIGLDACDICGETGYYERDGQVVCKLCDVVMNIQTIGFKGGCNPIVIDYSIRDGYIIIPFETLLENEVIFTR